MDNNEERMVIPHGPAAENGSNETPNKASDFSSDQDSDTQSTQSTPEPITNTVISHEEPIEQPSTAPSDTEPVDIFATPEERAAEPTAITGSSTHVNNTPFNSRNRYQGQSHNKFNNVPQFFSDAIIANTPIEQPKRSKKGLTIGIAIGSIVLFSLLLIVILTVRKSNNDTSKLTQASIKSETKELFYSYANFILSGKDSKEPVTLDNINYSSYAYLKNINTAAGLYNQSYANELSERFSNFAQKAKQDYGEEKGQIISMIDNYIELLTFIKSNPSRKELSTNTIVNTYLNDGESSAKNKIDSILSEYSKDNDIYKPFYEARRKSYESIIFHLKTLKENGCIKNSSINETCASTAQPKTIPDNYEPYAFVTYEAEAEYVVDTRVSDIASDCIHIASILEHEGINK